MAKTPAEIQAAYRERQDAWKQRTTALATEAHSLCRAIRNAADSGNPLAKEVCHKSDTQILRDLSQEFQAGRITVRRIAKALTKSDK